MSNCVLKADVAPLVQSEAPANHERLPQVNSPLPSFELRFDRTSWEDSACIRAFGNNGKGSVRRANEQVLAEFEEMQKEFGGGFIAGRLGLAQALWAELVTFSLAMSPRFAALVEVCFGDVTQLGKRTPNPDPVVKELNAAFQAGNIQLGQYSKLMTKIQSLADEMWHLLPKNPERRPIAPEVPTKK